MKLFLYIFLVLIVPSYNLHTDETANFKLEKTGTISLVPYFLIPLTKSEDLVRCSDVLDEVENFKKAIECTVREGIFTEDQVKGVIELPPCYVILETSADVKNYIGLFSYIRFTVFSDIKILGFYIPYNHVIYIVNNPVTLVPTYIHEVQHYLLNLLDIDGGNAAHDHEIWKKCQN